MAWTPTKNKLGNAIPCTFKEADGKKKVLQVHVVVCEEEWLITIQRKLKPKPADTPGFPASRSLYKTCMNVAIWVRAFVGGLRTVITLKNVVVIVTSIFFLSVGSDVRLSPSAASSPSHSCNHLRHPFCG
jgi:hypothetical protein